MMGTKNKEIKANEKIIGENLKRFSFSIEEKIKIMINQKKTKDKCLKKNE